LKNAKSILLFISLFEVGYSLKEIILINGVSSKGEGCYVI